MALLRPVSPPLAVLAALTGLVVRAAFAPPQLDLGATDIDPAAAAAGLHARVGPLDDWTVGVADTTAAGVVKLQLRGPDGRTQRRRVALTGTTAEDRSRELAASLALIIEQWDDPPSAPARSSPPTSTPSSSTVAGPAPLATPSAVRGWLGIGPRLGLGRALVEGGLDLQGGLWLLRGHLQPLASLGWSSSARDRLRMHTLRLGLGLALGAPLHGGRLWLGGHALGHAAWTHADRGRLTSAWASSTELGGLFQYRAGRWVAGLRSGLELALPPQPARADLARGDRGPLLWFLALNFGVVFG